MSEPDCQNLIADCRKLRFRLSPDSKLPPGLSVDSRSGRIVGYISSSLPTAMLNLVWTINIEIENFLTNSETGNRTFSNYSSGKSGADSTYNDSVPFRAISTTIEIHLKRPSKFPMKLALPAPSQKLHLKQIVNNPIPMLLTDTNESYDNHGSTLDSCFREWWEEEYESSWTPQQGPPKARVDALWEGLIPRYIFPTAAGREAIVERLKLRREPPIPEFLRRNVLKFSQKLRKMLETQIPTYG